MPELTGLHIGLLALVLVIGVAVGWILRAERCGKEKIAVNAGWQKQLDAQQSEHDRLAGQNKSLMEQVSQYQASHKDYSNRARELAESLKEAIARRDELQRQIKDIRRNLEVAVTQRNKLRDNLQTQLEAGAPAALKEKDEKIFRLSRELTSWQSRVPPLVERFQEKNREASELAEALGKAEERIAELEELTSFDQTRIEALNANSLPAGGFASNEPEAMTSVERTLGEQDDAGESGATEEIAAADESTQPSAESTPEQAATESDEWTDQVSDRADDTDDADRQGERLAAAESDETPVSGGELGDRDSEAVADADDDADGQTGRVAAAESDKAPSSGGEPDDRDSEAVADADDDADGQTGRLAAAENDEIPSSGAEPDDRDSEALADVETAESRNAIVAADWQDDGVADDDDDGNEVDIEYENEVDDEDDPDQLPESSEAHDEAPPSPAGQADGDEATDDLKKIKGIGPSIERTLNDLGISRFQQLAEMSEFEIDRVAQQLRGFRSRIYRENWIGQARDLHYDKINGRG